MQGPPRSPKLHPPPQGTCTGEEDVRHLETARQRLRFDNLVHETTPDGRCRMAVHLEWCGRAIVGEAEGLETHHGRVRASAEACLDAAVSAAGKRVHLSLKGVKAVRAFDGWVVVVRVLGEVGVRSFQLLGASSCETEEGLERSAGLAVLDATNRILEGQVGS